MREAVMSCLTRRSAVTGLAISAVPLMLKETTKASAQEKKSSSEKSANGGEKPLYERLGGIFAIAQVVDHFSDALIKNPIVGQKSENAQLREWHTNNLKR